MTDISLSSLEKAQQVVILSKRIRRGSKYRQTAERIEKRLAALEETHLSAEQALEVVRALRFAVEALRVAHLTTLGKKVYKTIELLTSLGERPGAPHLDHYSVRQISRALVRLLEIMTPRSHKKTLAKALFLLRQLRECPMSTRDATMAANDLELTLRKTQVEAHQPDLVRAVKATIRNLRSR